MRQKVTLEEMEQTRKVLATKESTQGEDVEEASMAT